MARWMQLALVAVAARTSVMASRKATRVLKSKSVAARPVELYTFGAPKVSFNLKRFPREGCFQGLRAENENYRKDGNNPRDIVPWLMATYRHPDMKTLRLFDDPAHSEERVCGWNRARDQEGKETDMSIDLHMTPVYEERSAAYGGVINTMAELGLHISYNVTPDLSYIQQKGWGLVDSAVVGGDEVSHLLQHPTSLECMLTFEGTDRIVEWIDNINMAWKTFCAHGFLHEGFRDSLLRMANSKDFQSKIRPNLGYCSKINVVGHSLGGAMATLWTGCVLSKTSNGRIDYENLKITWQNVKKLTVKS